MATVVNLGAGRVDPNLALGQAIEKGASRLADVMLAQSQQEWQEKMRREAEERAEKRQKAQEKRLLNRQIALEDNKRVHEGNIKRANATNDTRMYALLSEGSKTNKFGKRVLDPTKQEDFTTLANRLLPYTSTNAQAYYAKRVAEFGDNAAAATLTDLKIQGLTKLGVPLNVASVMYDEPLTVIKEYTNALKDSHGPGLRAMVSTGVFSPTIATMRSTPNPKTHLGLYANYMEFQDYLKDRGLSQDDAVRLLYEDDFLTKFNANQNEIEMLAQVFAKKPELKEDQHFIDTLKTYNLDASVFKTVLEARAKVASDSTLRRSFTAVMAALNTNQDPRPGDIATLQAGGPAYAAFAADAQAKLYEKRKYDFEFAGGVEAYTTIKDNPGKDHRLDLSIMRHSKDAKVQDALRLNSSIRLAKYLGMYDGIPEEQLLDRMKYDFATYEHDTSAFADLVKAEAFENQALGPIYKVLDDVKNNRPIDDKDFRKALGLASRHDIPGWDRMFSTLIDHFVNPTETWTIGGKSIRATKDNMATLLKVQLDFDTAALSEKEKGTYFDLVSSARKNPGEIGYLTETQFRAKMQTLKPGQQEEVLRVVGEQKVMTIKLTNAINDKLLPESERANLALLTNAQLDETIQKAIQVRTDAADSGLAQWLITRDTTTPVMTTFLHASAGVKTKVLDALNAQTARNFLRTAALEDFKRDTENRATTLSAAIAWPDTPLTEAIIAGASTSEAATNVVLSKLMAYQNSSRLAKEELGENFVVEAVWKPFFKDLPTVLGGTGIQIDVEGWDKANKMPLMWTGVGDARRKVTKAEVSMLRAIRTNYNLYEHWLQTSSIDKGLLGGSALLNETGQRQINIATASLIQQIFSNALRAGEIPVFSEILTYAHTQAANLNYQDKSGTFTFDSGSEWGKLAELKNISGKLGKPWAKHTLNTTSNLGKIDVTDPAVQNEKAYQAHFSGKDYHKTEFSAKIGNRTQKGGEYVFKGANSEARLREATRQVLTFNYDIPRDPSTMMLNSPDAIRDFPALFSQTLQFQYHLGNMLAESYVNTGKGTFEEALGAKIAEELGKRKGYVPTIEKSASVSPTIPGLDPVAQADEGGETFKNHSPLLLMPFEVYKQYGDPTKFRTSKQLNYLLARLTAMQALFTEMNANQRYQ